MVGDGARRGPIHSVAWSSQSSTQLHVARRDTTCGMLNAVTIIITPCSVEEWDVRRGAAPVRSISLARASATTHTATALAPLRDTLFVACNGARLAAGSRLSVPADAVVGVPLTAEWTGGVSRCSGHAGGWVSELLAAAGRFLVAGCGTRGLGGATELPQTLLWDLADV